MCFRRLLCVRDHSLIKCQGGGWLKIRGGGGHVKFHVDSRGVMFKLFQ